MLQFDPPEGAMEDATVVLLNGPPRSGKDTAGKYLTSVVPKSLIEKFAGTLKSTTHVKFGLYGIPDDYFEDCKDQPNDAFFGNSPRREYIDESEKRTKPFLGEQHYGKVLLRQLWRHYQAGVRNFFITDSGFAREAEPLIDSIGVQNFLLIRVHAEKRGCSFSGDSRSFIYLAGIPTYDIDNNDSVDVFQSALLSRVHPFVTGRTLLGASFTYGRM